MLPSDGVMSLGEDSGGGLLRASGPPPLIALIATLRELSQQSDALLCYLLPPAVYQIALYVNSSILKFALHF